MKPRKTSTFSGDAPAAWFAALRRAVRTRDFKLARTALAELARRGIAVAFVQAESFGNARDGGPLDPDDGTDDQSGDDSIDDRDDESGADR